MLYYQLPVPQTPAEIQALADEYVACLPIFQTDDRANDVFLFVDITLSEQHPEIAWQVILRAIESVPTAQAGLIGASALEDLLLRHPATYLPLAEAQALQNPKFRPALGHVWRSGMPLAWWLRLEAFRSDHREWWLDTPPEA